MTRYGAISDSGCQDLEAWRILWARRREEGLVGDFQQSLAYHRPTVTPARETMTWEARTDQPAPEDAIEKRAQPWATTQDGYVGIGARSVDE